MPSPASHDDQCEGDVDDDDQCDALDGRRARPVRGGPGRRQQRPRRRRGRGRATTAAPAAAAVTTTTAARAAEVATTSAAESLARDGRPDDGAAALRVSELFERHGATVLGLCRVLLRNEHEAEDAAQQTFLAAYRSLLNGGEPRYPAAWLATIARNECWSIIGRRMREPLGDAEPEGSLPDPVVAAAERADLRELWRAIGALPRQQRRAILLREFSGLSYDELAVALGVSEPAVESLLFRARRELRTRLRPVYRLVRDRAAERGPRRARAGRGEARRGRDRGRRCRRDGRRGGDAHAAQGGRRATGRRLRAARPRTPGPRRAGPAGAPGVGAHAVPPYRAPAPTRHSAPALRPPAPVSDASAAPSAGGIGTPPVVTPPAEPPAPAPAAVPTAAPPEPPPSVGRRLPRGRREPGHGRRRDAGTSGSGDGGTSSGEGSGGADDHSGPAAAVGTIPAGRRARAVATRRAPVAETTVARRARPGRVAVGTTPSRAAQAPAARLRLRPTDDGEPES